MNEHSFTTIELFAGVGGFRLGLEGQLKNKSYYSAISEYSKKIHSQCFFNTGYVNQFEPGRAKQFAAIAYQHFFNDLLLDNRDIQKVSAKKILDSIKDSGHADDKLILVGGFPCQDYSVANGLHNAKGLVGKKGVLWWEIYRLISELKKEKRQPELLLLENVDRLLSSPAKQRGRDFAIMLYTLNTLGYTVEYKVINAAEYGFPQKRKRVFILAYLKESPLSNKKRYHYNIDCAFPCSHREAGTLVNLKDYKTGGLIKSLQNLEYEFNYKVSPFLNSGICKNFVIRPFKEKTEVPDNVKTLGDVLEDPKNVAREFYVNKSELKKWKAHKSAKKILRYKPNGDPYYFSEGNMSLFDRLDSPSRTIITSEGGNSSSRTKHLITDAKGSRRLTPVELERLNMFPDNITKHESISNSERAFLMGNALVIGVVEKFRNQIISAYGKPL